MAIQTIARNGFRVFRANEDLGLRSNISELEGMVRDALDAGESKIAISFTANSRLYSNTIAVIVRCISHAEEKGVKLTLVVPSDNIMNSIVLVGLAGLVAMVRSEDELGDAQA